MTIFHILKYQITDVTKQDQLDPLPKEVVAKWRLRVEDFAIEQAKSVVHLDVAGMAQKAIDAIYLYRDGKITSEELSVAANAANAAADAAGYNAAGYNAAAADAGAAAYYAAYAAAYYAAANAAYYAANAAYYAAADWYKVKQESLDLFKKWLIEELYKFEITDIC